MPCPTRGRSGWSAGDKESSNLTLEPFTRHQNMVSPVKDVSSQIDPTFQQQLHDLVSMANIHIDPRVFSVILDLLRNGVSPDSIYAFLVKASKLSKLGKKLQEDREKQSQSNAVSQNDHVGDVRPQ